MAKRYTVAVDFDGVLHSYTTPLDEAGDRFDPPVPGAIEWLNEIAKRFDVVVLTTRGGDSDFAVRVGLWLADHGYEGPPLCVTDRKPPALIYIDDRAWRFEGTFPSTKEVYAARPWHRLASPAPPDRPAAELPRPLGESDTGRSGASPRGTGRA